MDALESRTGLPDALRVLLTDYPRENWTGHRNFDGLVSFWLDRHLMFRRMTTLMTEANQSLLDRRIDPQQFAANLSRIGGQFVQDLHGHHQIEDHHYFPVLTQMELRLAKGFELLDHDHQALDGHIQSFITGANAVLQSLADRDALQDAAGRFAGDLANITALLDRHLTDEEDLIVPVILLHGPGRLG